MKYVNFNASNLAQEEDSLSKRNSVFNPVLYEMAGGKIETFDPAYASRERARQREAARQKKNRINARRRSLRKAKLKRQRLIGVMMLMLADVLSLIYLACGSIPVITTSVILLLASLWPLFSKKVIEFKFQ